MKHCISGLTSINEDQHWQFWEPRWSGWSCNPKIEAILRDIGDIWKNVVDARKWNFWLRAGCTVYCGIDDGVVCRNERFWWGKSACTASILAIRDVEEGIDSMIRDPMVSDISSTVCHKWWGGISLKAERTEYANQARHEDSRDVVHSEVVAKPA